MSSSSDFIAKVRTLNVDRSHGPAALKKPLFLLLLVSKYEAGTIKENRFHFADYSQELSDLILAYGGKAATSGPKPEQPFFYLKSDGFWSLHFPSTASPEQLGKPSVPILRNPESFGRLDPDLHRKLLTDPEYRSQFSSALLATWFQDTAQEELISELRLPSSRQTTSRTLEERARSAEFRIHVLENYRYKCTLCGFNALLNKHPFGLEAAHIRALQYDGPDSIDNGFALCRIHHVLFDRGAVSVDGEQRAILSSKLVIQDDALHGMISGIQGKRIARATKLPPNENFIRWHRENVFLD